MVNIQELDPSASPLDYYGWELRRRREAHRLTQQQLGDAIFCTGSLVGQIETARKLPTREFSERVDAALDTDGAFCRLVGLVLRSRLPAWFQPYADLEARATYISAFQAQVVYGLLQTPEYARALLAVDYPDKTEEMSAGEHTALMGSFNLLRFEDDPDIFYAESYDQGHMTANPSVIKDRSVGYARLQATALSVEDSAVLIARVMEERYGDPS
ncbi:MULTISPECIES: Scr1 family TA system antitoxin-like transcriptional regulator [unclassified Streptomyces]|uniref:Scr1 family TA system antitoxin-like transcriptional regulator n=1 Tax=unclassified Streptomyces TaxID=2593676 RepID=UPI0035E0B89E